MTETTSVIICTYNYGRFLGRCLESVVSQTQPPDEIIVVDDGSEDDTVDVVRRFQGVTYIRQRRGGKAMAFNHGFEVSTGNIICHLDADDYWAPNKLERTLSVLASFPSIGAVMHQVTYVDEEGNPLFSAAEADADNEFQPVTRVTFEDYLSTFIYSNVQRRTLLGVPNTISVRRCAVESYLPFPGELGLAIDGALLHLAARQGLACLASPLSAYRHHGANSFVNNPDAHRGEWALFDWLIHHADYGQALPFAEKHLLRARRLETELIHLCHQRRRSARGFVSGCQLICHMVAGCSVPAWRHLAATITCIFPEIFKVREALLK